MSRRVLSGFFYVEHLFFNQSYRIISIEYVDIFVVAIAVSKI